MLATSKVILGREEGELTKRNEFDKKSKLNFTETNAFMVCLLLFYAIATVFKLHHGADMMYEMRTRKPESTLLPTQGIFNHPQLIGIV